MTARDPGLKLLVVDTRLLRMPAADLAPLVTQRAVSPLALVDAHISEIERVNPRINALVATRFDDAREEAQAMTDRLIDRSLDELPPLFGVPCTVKETFSVPGMPWTAGS